jgi:hypothetical protein
MPVCPGCGLPPYTRTTTDPDLLTVTVYSRCATCQPRGTYREEPTHAGRR